MLVLNICILLLYQVVRKYFSEVVLLLDKFETWVLENAGSLVLGCIWFEDTRSLECH